MRGRYDKRDEYTDSRRGKEGETHRLSELRVSENDVRVGEAVVVLSGEVDSVVNGDHEDTERFRVPLDAVTGDELSLRGTRLSIRFRGRKENWGERELGRTMLSVIDLGAHCERKKRRRRGQPRIRRRRGMEAYVDRRSAKEGRSVSGGGTRVEGRRTRRRWKTERSRR